MDLDVALQRVGEVGAERGMVNLVFDQLALDREGQIAQRLKRDQLRGGVLRQLRPVEAVALNKLAEHDAELFGLASLYGHSV